MEQNTKKQKEEFIQLLKSTEREGIDNLIEDLEELGFFEAPASAGHHLNVAGGLVEHSLNTYKAALVVWEGLKKLEPSLDNVVKKDSIIITSLLHDLCKADIYYRTVKKRKTSLGTWEDAEGYRTTYKNFPMGHGEKSLVLALCSGLELSDDEMLAIRWHMGAWGINQNSIEEVKNYDAARMLYPLVTIIQTADGLAAAILERTAEKLDDL
ncbi:MAG: HD family phosphohydrolase [Bacteroidaceae bacterium]|nr:HD family phosphohydrolase [Bacteroidaceae bacterium]